MFVFVPALPKKKRGRGEREKEREREREPICLLKHTKIK
jgi:hypothetical protein